MNTMLKNLFFVMAFFLFLSNSFSQNVFPSKTIRIIAPYPSGSSVDIVGRIVAQKLSEALNVPVILDNKPGANTVIGTNAMLSSAPDGHTLLLITSAHVINPHLLSLPYDSIKDFYPVGTLVSSELVLVINSSIPVNNFNEFIFLAKSRGAQLNNASPGVGSPAHLASEMFFQMTGLNIQTIHYKGAGQSIIDLIGGQSQLSFVAPSTALLHLKNNKLKALAISGEQRNKLLPQVSTFSEYGIKGLDVKYWYGLVAPSSTSKIVVDRLSLEIIKIISNHEISEKLHNQGLESFVSNSEQFFELMKSDLLKFNRIIKSAGIRMEE